MFDEDFWSDEEIDPAIPDALLARAALACRDVCTAFVEPVARCLVDPTRDVRLAAADCMAKVLREPELADRRPAFRASLERAARTADAEERGVLLLSLGELGGDTSAFLSDPEPMVRTCAALAPAQAANEAATRVILEALETPAAADEWLPHNVPQLDGWLRFRLVDEAIRRTRSFEALLPGALAVARMAASPLTVERDWGRFT